MPILTLSPAERRALKARAHFLDPVVRIGAAGCTPAVRAEIERHLAVHELIKVRVADEDREGREALFAQLSEALSATPVQHIGKLLVLYRPLPDVPEPAAPPSKGRARKTPAKKTAPRRIPGAPKPSTRKVTVGTRPPRTERIRRSGQQSRKKAFQTH